MTLKNVVENKDGSISYDFRIQPLDTNVANNVGDVVRRHLVCRVNPNFFNDACLNLRATNGLPDANEVDAQYYDTDPKLLIPIICASCPAIPAAIRTQLEQLLQ